MTIGKRSLEDNRLGAAPRASSPSCGSLQLTLTARTGRGPSPGRWVAGPRLRLVDEQGAWVVAGASDGSGVRYRLTLEFADDPASFFSGGKLEASVTVESDGGVHHGRFDGQTWHTVGLDQAPSLPSVLSAGPGSRRLS